MCYIPYTTILTLALTLSLFILKACHYIGYTGRGNFGEESYGFLTPRGPVGRADRHGNYVPRDPAKRSRAVIVWKSGDNVKPSEAGNQKKTLVLLLLLVLTLTLTLTLILTLTVKNLGFTSFLLFTSTIQYNARCVEDELQSRFMSLELGFRRLYRKPDCGGKYKSDYTAHHVFLDISFKAQSMIRDGSLRIQV